VRSAGIAGTRFEVCHADGRVIRAFRAQPGGKLILALRPILHGALLDAVGPGDLVLGSAVVGVSRGVRSAGVKLLAGGTDEGDIVIGADGVASVIRSALHPDEPAAWPSGFYALRGVARGVVHHLGELAGVGYLGDGVEAAAARASEDAVYWYLSLLAPDVSPTEGPRAIVDRVTAEFDPRFRAIVTATDSSDMRLDQLLQRRALTTWGSGRVTLLGDAAHPVLPHTGQGAAQALEDAVALGLALRGDDPDKALRKYEEVRSARTRRVIAAGPRIARVTTTRNPLIKVMRNAVIRYVPESLLVKGAPGRSDDPHRALRRDAGLRA
jgi:2-polyprenyl-6-methoxyphenol hydroxylase-like FAD-dependent oxidoreductase